MWARLLVRRASCHLVARPYAASHSTCKLVAQRLTPAASASRWFGTRSSADTRLGEVLKSEIEHERGEEAKKGSVKGSAGPFELVDKPGTTEVLLTRTLGDEKLTVTCQLEKTYNDDEEEEEEKEDDESSEETEVEEVHMVCKIVKEKKAVEIHCMYAANTTEIEVQSVSYLKEDEEDKGEKNLRPYDGPAFEDLDDDVQKAFHDLVKARGLTVKVAQHVLEFMRVKEQREYTRWLQNVEAFFSP